MYEIEYIQNGQKHQINWFGDVQAFKRQAAREGKVVLRAKEPTIWQRLRQRVKSEEMIAGLTALGDLLSSGVVLSNALATVASSFSTTSKACHVFHGLANAVRTGISLSRAMEAYPEAFSVTTTSMIASGESAGKLAETVSAVAEHIREMDEVRREIIQKLTYPVFIFVFGVGALFVNTGYVIPKILSSDLFKQAGAKAASGQIFITLLNWMSVIVPVLIVCLIIAAVVLAVLFRFRQHAVEKIIVKIPIIRAIIFDRAYFVAFASLANLTAVGVRLAPAIEIVSSSIRLHLIKEEFEAAYREIKSGGRPSAGMKNLNETERTMMDVSQNSERIQKNFALISRRYYQSFVGRVKGIGPRIYGSVLVLVFGMFILMLLGVMLPYFNIIGGIK